MAYVPLYDPLCTPEKEGIASILPDRSSEFNGGMKFEIGDRYFRPLRQRNEPTILRNRLLKGRSWKPLELVSAGKAVISGHLHE
jgi:hypothetical protein